MKDAKYFGVYSAYVESTDDPLSLGRITFRCPQVLGEEDKAVSNWAKPIGGAIAQVNYPYATFYTNTDQSIDINTATVINNWIEADTNRSYLDGNKFYVEETGDYFFQFSCMFIKTNASAGTADMWIRKNGIDIPDSNTRITLAGSNAEVTMTVGLILDLDAGDYLQMVSSASASNTLLSHSPAGVGPAVPGVIATLNLVGKYKPQYKQPIWVMFQGGDPDFPLWIGAQ